MEIFNVHIFEFLVIAGLALVIFGPERLPEVGRFIGQQVAKFLAWQQQSPELQMLNEVRSEFEREIASLRDELVRTRQQLDISGDLSQIKDDLRPMLDLKGNLKLPGEEAANGVNAAADMPGAGQTLAPPELPARVDLPETADLPAAPGPGDVAEVAADALAPDAPITVRPAAQTVPAAAAPNRLAYTAPTTALGAPAPPVGDQQFAEAPAAPEANGPAPQPGAPDERVEYLRRRREALHDAPPPDPAPVQNGVAAHDEAGHEQLLLRLHALAADLQALTAELRERGVIGADWRLPDQPAEQETMPR